jgi:hypothetical protein
MRDRFTSCLFLVVWLAAGSANAAPTKLPVEQKAPYSWRVVVQTKPHPLLGPAVRAQLQKDLKAALVPSLGDELGSVEVIDLAATPKEKWEPLWKAFGEKGWPALEEDEFRKLGGGKTHFLKVWVEGGRFRLESRQHDGTCGMTSPIVRISDAEPDKLGRAAGLMVGMDFGPVGTVETLPDTKTRCLIRLRGGELPGMDRWVKVGDVFAFAVIRETARPQPKGGKPPAVKPGQPLDSDADRVAKPREFTLLRVADIPQPGVATCEILSRYAKPFPDDWQVVGYRAMRLTTRDAAVAVRVADQKNNPPPPATPIEVWASDNGFRDRPTPTDTLGQKGGLFTSGRTLRGIACVKVKLGSDRIEPFVVPVLDGGRPVPLRFEFDETAVKRANFENTCERAASRTRDALMALTELFVGLRDQIGKGDNQAALDRANAGLKTLAETDETLTAELTRLRQDPLATGETIKRQLDAIDRNLIALREGKPELSARIEDLKVAVAKANNPAEFEREFKARELARTIAYHEGRGEIELALELYDQLAELTKQEDVKARKQKLEEEWKPKSPEQAAARKAISEDWAALTQPDEIKAGIAKLKSAIAELVKSQDRLGLRLAATGLQSAGLKLIDALNVLDPELVQDKEKIQAIKTTADDLRKIDTDTRAELAKLEPKK